MNRAVVLEVAELFAPDYPSHEGGYTIDLDSEADIGKYVDALKNRYAEVYPPRYDERWTVERNDGKDYWTVVVFENAAL